MATTSLHETDTPLNEPGKPARRQMGHTAIALGFLTAAFALAYPFSVWRTLPDAHFAEVWRWWHNEPSFNLFLVFIFPFAVAVFFDGFNLSFISAAKGGFHKACLWALLLALLAIVIGGVYVEETTNRALPPYMFADTVKALKSERAHRDTLKDPRSRKFLEAENGTKRAEDERKNYIAEVGKENLGTTAYVATALNLFAFIIVALFVWQSIGLFSVGHSDPQLANDLLLVYAILLLDVPIRAYSEWYTNFYVVRPIWEYQAGLAVLVAAVVLVPVLVVLLRGPRSAKPVATAMGVFVLVFAIVGKVKAEWLWDIAGGLESVGALPFAVAVVLCVAVLGGLVNLVRQRIVEPSREAEWLGKWLGKFTK